MAIMTVMTPDGIERKWIGRLDTSKTVLDFMPDGTKQTMICFNDSMNSTYLTLDETEVKKLQTSSLQIEMLEAMQEFCDRVDKGEVKSTYTYNKFKSIIENATK